MTDREKENLFEEVACNLCGSREYTVKYRVSPTADDVDFTEMYSSSSGVIGKDRLVKCANCGLIYVSPRLRKQVILDGYAAGNDENYISQSRGRIETFQKGLRFVEKFKPGRGRILDVGAAAGFFLKVAGENGWEAYGVEPSAWLAEYGRRQFQVNLQPGTLKDGNFSDEFFDAVTLWDVLEHTTDPLAELREVHRILKRGGVVVINYPNIGSLMARLAGKRWWFILSVHLFYFTPKTIAAMLEKAGFEVEASKRHYQKLSFSYLIFRLEPYSRFASKALNMLCTAFRLSNLQIPYYAAQRVVAARKRE